MMTVKMFYGANNDDNDLSVESLVVTILTRVVDKVCVWVSKECTVKIREDQEKE